MTAVELLKTHKMAKEFAELYSVTGLISVRTDGIKGTPLVHLRTTTFFELFGDGEYEYVHHDDSVTVETIYDGVKYITLVGAGETINKGVADE